MSNFEIGDEAREPANWRWRTDPLPPGPAVVVDIDGVLADATGRQHLIVSETADWRAFFDAAIDDPVVEEIARLLDLLDKELQVVLLTGRPLRIQLETARWLEHHHLRWDLLVMRDRGNYAKVTNFKRASVELLRSFGFDLRLALEDDPMNRDMLRDNGVPCVYIHSGYYS